jgi:DNA-binding GntR family transcriptional regulator
MHAYAPGMSDARKPIPPEPSGSLADRAYDLFREGLRTGSFRPGQRLLETELAEQLGMSRTPVREAIRRLQSEGLIAHLPARGLCVAAYDPAQVDELYVMREALEGTAARLAAQHAGRPEIALLQRLLEQERDLTGEAAADHNRRFHRALHQAAHNRYLLRSLSAISDALLLLGPTTLEVPVRAAAARAEHARIVAAIAARDATAAEAAARAHIAAAHEARLAMAAAEPA